METENKKMYTIHGIEVSLVKKIDEGYLAKQIYNYNGYEEDESEIEETCDEVNFYEKLYDKPVTEKYAKEVNELIVEREKVAEEISILRETKRNEEYLLNKINKFPILKKLADYLTGDFKFHMDFDRYQILPKEKAYLPTNVKVVNFKSNGWCLYKLRNEDSESYDDTPFMIFNTIEEAVEYSRKLLITRIQQYKKSDYWSSRGLKEEHDKISYNNPVKQDAEYLKSYNEILSFVIDREKTREAKRLKEEIEALENKKKKLEDLSKTN